MSYDPNHPVEPYKDQENFDEHIREYIYGKGLGQNQKDIERQLEEVKKEIDGRIQKILNGGE